MVFPVEESGCFLKASELPGSQVSSPASPLPLKKLNYQKVWFPAFKPSQGQRGENRVLITCCHLWHSFPALPAGSCHLHTRPVIIQNKQRGWRGGAADTIVCQLGLQATICLCSGKGESLPQGLLAGPASSCCSGMVHLS